MTPRVPSPIGVFDSGLGGLGVAEAIRKRLPGCDVIYVGDTAHLPYGDKSALQLLEYGRVITQFLMDQGCQTVVIACHTASSVIREPLKALFGARVQWVDMITPLMRELTLWARRESRMLHCGLVGTHQTVHAQVYEQAIRDHHVNITMHAVATPLWVPVVEYTQHAGLRRMAVEHDLACPAFDTIQGLVLGCTHYPVLSEIIRDFFAARHQPVELFDASQAASEWLAVHGGVLPRASGQGTLTVYLSDTSPWFVNGISAWSRVSEPVRLLPRWVWHQHT